MKFDGKYFFRSCYRKLNNGLPKIGVSRANGKWSCGSTKYRQHLEQLCYAKGGRGCSATAQYSLKLSVNRAYHYADLNEKREGLEWTDNKIFEEQWSKKCISSIYTLMGRENSLSLTDLIFFLNFYHPE